MSRPAGPGGKLGTEPHLACECVSACPSRLLTAGESRLLGTSLSPGLEPARPPCGPGLSPESRAQNLWGHSWAPLTSVPPHPTTRGPWRELGGNILLPSAPTTVCGVFRMVPSASVFSLSDFLPLFLLRTVFVHLDLSVSLCAGGFLCPPREEAARSGQLCQSGLAAPHL